MAATTRRQFLLAGAVALGGVATLALPEALLTPARPVGLVLPGDPGYDAARTNFNTRFRVSPASIQFCDTVDDVRGALRRAREAGQQIRARSGRHSYAGFSLVEGGAIIDVSPMREIRVDAKKGAATIGAGARLAQVYESLWRQGVTIPAGTFPSVGIAGLTLGGGVGFLTRSLGLTCDWLEGVEMVTADGNVVHADASENADLFWALRGGGGGNFGIVTAFRFRVQPVGEVSIFKIDWKWRDAPRVIDAWQRWTARVDERLTSSLEAQRVGEEHLVVEGQFTGSHEELGALLAPLLRVGTSPQLMSRRVPFIEAVRYFVGSPLKGTAFKRTGAYVYQDLPAEAIAALVERLERGPGLANNIELLALGGAAARVAPDATAYGHRKAAYLIQCRATWNRPEDEAANTEWADATRATLVPYTVGTYVNFPDPAIADWPEAYYGANLARLVAVKAKYDPRNVFRFPHAIPIVESA
jgi:FAD/FMN-containing dehydrogenase